MPNLYVFLSLCFFTAAVTSCTSRIFLLYDKQHCYVEHLNKLSSLTFTYSHMLLLLYPHLIRSTLYVVSG